MSPKKPSEESAKKENRAIMLFDYIEKCNAREKQMRRQKLAEFVGNQRKQLEIKTAELMHKRANELKMIEENRRTEYKSKRAFLVGLGRVRPKVEEAVVNNPITPRSYDALSSIPWSRMDPLAEKVTPMIQSEPDNQTVSESIIPDNNATTKRIYKSKIYREQAKEFKFERQKHTIHYEQALYMKKRTIDAGRHIIIPSTRALSIPKVMISDSFESETNEEKITPKFQNQQEFDDFMDKYNRLETPMHKLNTLEAPVTKQKNIDMTITMLESIKKNKYKTKHLTSGQVNQYGFTSAIADHFDQGFRHGRSVDDPLWSANKPDPELIPTVSDPLEWKLKAKKEIEKIRPSVMKREDDRNKAFDDVDLVDIPTIQSEGEKQQVQRVTKEIVNKQTESAFTEEDLKVMQKADQNLKQSRSGSISKTKTLQLKIKTKLASSDNDQLPTSSLIDDGSRTLEKEYANLKSAYDDEKDSEERSLNASRILLAEDAIKQQDSVPITSQRKNKPQKSVEFTFVDPSMIQNVTSGPKSPASIELQPNSGSEPLNPRRSILIPPKPVEPQKLKRLSKVSNETKVSFRKSNSIINFCDDAIQQFPFDNSTQLFPKHRALPSLSEWTESIRKENAVQKQMDYWAPVNLEAVAEFGRTVYLDKMKVANAAENDRTNRPRYQAQTGYVLSAQKINLDTYKREDGQKVDYYTHPAIGSQKRFWKNDSFV